MLELPTDRAPDLNHVAVSGRTVDRSLATAQPAGVDQVEVSVVLGVSACRTREYERRSCCDCDRNEHTSHTNTIDCALAMRLCRPGARQVMGTRLRASARRQK